MNSKEMFEVLNRVSTWEPEMRIDLVDNENLNLDTDIEQKHVAERPGVPQ